MTTTRRSIRSSRRALTLVTFALTALALSACTGAPAPDSTRTPPPQYAAQPDFASVEAPADFVAAPDSTTATFSAEYSDKGSKFDAAQIMNVAQGGYPPMSNRRWFIDRLPQLSEMGVQRVRIDQVLNDAFYHVVNKQPDGSITYDFTLLDEVVLGFVEQGFQPLLALSYTPSALGKSNGAVPDLEGWKQAVAAVVGHYRDLGYTGWDWEVWNEPDHNHWTGEQYNALYSATAPVIKAADPTSRVGGAVAAFLTSEGDISGKFISYIGTHRDVPADFFSVHSYASNGWEVVSAAKDMLAAAGLDLPVLITEWALDPTMTSGPGFGSDTNASPTGAAYVARRLALAGDSGAERVFYFAPVEGFTYAMPYNGDLGLITVDGHRKSIGNVFQMYSELGDTRIDLTAAGTGTETQDVAGFLSKDSKSRDVTLLMWNDTDSDVDAAITVDDLPFADSNYRITQRVISGTQGNGFSDASTVVAASYPSPNEHAPIISDVVHGPSDALEESVVVPAHGVLTVALRATSLEPGDVDRALEPAAINIASPQFGSTVSASSSVEDPGAGWGLAGATDGRRYSVDIASAPLRGFSSDVGDSDSTPQSLTVDFGSSRPVDSISLWPYTPRSALSSGFPVDAVLQASTDGQTWEDLATLANYNGAAPVSGEQVFTFPATEARYVRLTANRLGSTQGGYALQLAELAAYRLGIVNGGFESNSLDGWDVEGTASVLPQAARTAEKGAQLDAQSSMTTEIKGLRPSTSYIVGVYAKGAAGTARLSVTLPADGRSASTPTSVSGWQHIWQRFTTDDDETSATISIANTGDGQVWLDDAMLMQESSAQ